MGKEIFRPGPFDFVVRRPAGFSGPSSPTRTVNGPGGWIEIEIPRGKTNGGPFPFDSLAGRSMSP